MGTVNTLSVVDCEDVAWFRDGPSLPAAARGTATALARRIGLEDHRIAELALAVTEAATNVQRHAEDGALVLRVLRAGGRTGVEFLTVDSGPGMVDVAAALADGTSATGTLGIGLGAVARLADAFDVHSVPGKGTVIAAQFWPRAMTGHTSHAVAQRPAQTASGVTRPISGESTCGDAWAVRRVGTAGAPALLVLMCDGLGHGPLAARVASTALEAFRGTTSHDPEGVLTAVHRALHGSRGGAVAVARVDGTTGRLTYCGVGNISGFLIGHGSRRALLSAPGIVGHQMRRLRTFEESLSPEDALVMHSDGLTERWDPAALPGLLRHSPAVMAGQLLREAGVRRDDAGVVVVRNSW
ncbi:ATP-binding protein [Streptomyces sp. NPDC094038]|uniref:ATP-binding protein n=1 Tax=Streptomyces sp. NPDC094038 TaxID=3366055 RepID=UPI003813FA54